MKSCPFCDGERIEFVNNSGLQATKPRMECRDCGAQGPPCVDFREALRKWDERGVKSAGKALGAAGGAKGGIARAATLPAARRVQIAKDAALTRWNKKGAK